MWPDEGSWTGGCATGRHLWASCEASKTQGRHEARGPVVFPSGRLAPSSRARRLRWGPRGGAGAGPGGQAVSGLAPHARHGVSSLGLFLLQATMWGVRREEGFEPAAQELSAHLPAAPRAEFPICSGINPEGLLSGEVRAAGGGVAQPELPVPPGGGLTPECREGAGG